MFIAATDPKPPPTSYIYLLFNYLGFTRMRFKAPNKPVSGTSFSLVYTTNEGVKVLI